jgi:hypothetical protein
MLLAATDALGDAATIWRAAAALGIGIDAAAAAASEQPPRHRRGRSVPPPAGFGRPSTAPLSEEERQADPAGRWHDATDPERDADRRAWHQAQRHLRSGRRGRGRARTECRTGSGPGWVFAAAAALLERSTSLTSEPRRRVERRLAAGHSHLRAGSFDAARERLAVADSESSDEFVRVRVELLRGLVGLRRERGQRRLGGAWCTRRSGSSAWIEPSPGRPIPTRGSPPCTRATLAGPGGNLVDVSLATRAAPRPDVPRAPFGQVIGRLGQPGERPAGRPPSPSCVMPCGGCSTRSCPPDRWLQRGVMGAVAAAAVWDVDSGAPSAPARSRSPASSVRCPSCRPPLNVLALVTTWQGDLEAAAVLVAEHYSIKQATGIQVAPYGAMFLSAYRGRVPEALAWSRRRPGRPPTGVRGWASTWPAGRPRSCTTGRSVRGGAGDGASRRARSCPAARVARGCCRNGSRPRAV